MQAADFFMAQLNDTPYYFRVESSTRPNVRLADPVKLDSGKGAASLLPETATVASAADTSVGKAADADAQHAASHTGDIVERWGGDQVSQPQDTPPASADLLEGRNKQRARVAAHARAAAAAGFAPAGADLDGAGGTFAAAGSAALPGASSALTVGIPANPAGATGSTPAQHQEQKSGGKVVPLGVPVFDLSASKRRRAAEDAAAVERSRAFMAELAAQGGIAGGIAAGHHIVTPGGAPDGGSLRRAALAADMAGTPAHLRGVLPPGMSEHDAILKAGSDLVKSLDKWEASVAKQAAQRLAWAGARRGHRLPTLPKRRPVFSQRVPARQHDDAPAVGTVAPVSVTGSPPHTVSAAAAPPPTQGLTPSEPSVGSLPSDASSSQNITEPRERPTAVPAYKGRALASKGGQGGSYRMGWGLFEDGDDGDSSDASDSSSGHQGSSGPLTGTTPSSESPLGKNVCAADAEDAFESDRGKMLAAPLQGGYALEGEASPEEESNTTEHILKQALGEKEYAAALAKGGAWGGASETKSPQGPDKKSKSVKMPIVGVLSGAPPAAEIEARSESAGAAARPPAPPSYRLSDFTKSSFARLMAALQGWVTQRTLVLNGLGKSAGGAGVSPSLPAETAARGGGQGGIGGGIGAAAGLAEYEKLDTIVTDASPQMAALSRQVAQAFSQVCRSCPGWGGGLSQLLTPPVQRHVSGVMRTFEVRGDAHDFTPPELRALALVVALSAPCLREWKQGSAQGVEKALLGQWTSLLRAIGGVIGVNELRVLFGVLCGGHRHMLDLPVTRAFMKASGLSEADIELARAHIDDSTAEAEVSAASSAAGGAVARATARSITRAIPLVAGRPSREQLLSMSPQQQAEWGEISRQAALRLISLREDGATL